MDGDGKPEWYSGTIDIEDEGRLPDGTMDIEGTGQAMNPNAIRENKHREIEWQRTTIINGIGRNGERHGKAWGFTT
jgi:hypothetical protein